MNKPTPKIYRTTN